MTPPAGFSRLPAQAELPAATVLLLQVEPDALLLAVADLTQVGTIRLRHAAQLPSPTGPDALRMVATAYRTAAGRSRPAVRLAHRDRAAAGPLLADLRRTLGPLADLRWAGHSGATGWAAAAAAVAVALGADPAEDPELVELLAEQAATQAVRHPYRTWASAASLAR